MDDLSVGRSVGLYYASVGLSSALWKNDGSVRMPFGIICRTGPGIRQVGLGISLREGVLLGANLGRAIVTNGDFTAYGLRQCLNRRSCGLGWYVRWAEALLY